MAIHLVSASKLARKLATDRRTNRSGLVPRGKLCRVDDSLLPLCSAANLYNVVVLVALILRGIRDASYIRGGQPVLFAQLFR